MIKLDKYFVISEYPRAIHCTPWSFLRQNKKYSIKFFWDIIFIKYYYNESHHSGQQNCWRYDYQEFISEDTLIIFDNNS